MMKIPRAANSGSLKVKCRRCGRDLHPGRGDFRVISILAVTDPSPPAFTEDDLSLNVEEEIQRMLAQMRDLDAQKAQDQVYRRTIFHLCDSCYHNWIQDPTG